jgi:uncharacterized protein (TIGR02302 family)
MKQISPSHLARSVALQRLALLWERLWTAIHWPLIVAGVALAVVASGILQNFPAVLRLALLLALGLGFLVSLRAVVRLIRPSKLEAMRRMERAAAVVHRPLSSVADVLSPEFIDPRMDAVWEEHKRRQLLALTSVRVSGPRSAWAMFDPRALRVPVALAALAALLLGPGSVATNLQEAVQLAPPVAAKPLSLDAWLKPPAYTGKPPLLLSAPSMMEKLARGEDLLVPEQSVFTARVSGARNPAIKVLDTTGAVLGGELGGEMGTALGLKQSQASADVLTAELKLTRPLTIVLQDETGELARYPLTLVPDAAPTVSMSKPPTAESRGALITEWQVKDDYGVKSLTGAIELADEQEGGLGFESNGVFLFEAPEVKFALRRPNAKDETGKTTHDLASHPWAGLRVNLTLTAQDAAGQEGVSDVVSFALPERQFVRPLAQALIEQRKALILYPEKARQTGEVLDTLMLFPEGLVDRSGHVVAISSLASRLRNAAGYDDVKWVVASLWDLAVEIEEGITGDARAELLALKKELEKALADGAPPERIAELMDKMRDAMDRFMEAMRQEAERRMKDGTLQRNQQAQQGKPVTREDLQKMLDALEEMAKGGSREMAQRMLDELERMLQNMQPGMGEQAQGNGEMSEMMDQLGEMMQRQQGLMDETMRNQPGQGEEGAGEPGAGEQGAQGEEGNRGKGQGGMGGQGQNGQNGLGGLADRQGALQDMLDGLMRQGQGLGQLPSELGDASRAMEGAEQGLRNGDRDGALRDQGEALDKLRKGAGKLAQQMRENGQGQADNEALDGEGRGGRDDPLGRPRATRNPDTGPEDDILPTEQAMKRAREILETLRAKSNEQGLTDSERGYIERLLRGLY